VTDSVTDYARAAVAGEAGRPISALELAAYQRHLDDLEHAAERGLVWSVDTSEWAIAFFAQLPHTKGKQWLGKPLDLQPWQRFIVGSIFGWLRPDGTRRFRRSYVEIARKNGKALGIETPVPTPTGWTEHGSLRPGDVVFDQQGRQVRVVAVTPHYVGECFDVEAAGGCRIVAHERHEWQTSRTAHTGRNHGSREPLPLVETAQLAATLTHAARGDRTHGIPVAGALRLPVADLPIPPYAFGAWIGDGHSATGRITFADTAIADRIRGEGVPIHPRFYRGKAITYVMSAGRSQRERNASIAARLRRLGVLGHKRIPAIYLRASCEQRLEVLRGIVDTDGHCTKRGQYEVVSKWEALAADIAELVNTLGMKATISEDRATINGRDCGPRFRVQFFAPDGVDVATLERKIGGKTTAGRRRSLTRMVVRADRCGERTVNCIQVEGGTYLAGRDFVATHNSTIAAGVALLLAFFDGEARAEVYIAATKREQAKIVFDECRAMVKQTRGLRTRITVAVGSLFSPSTGNKLVPLGADADTTDGLNISGAIVDELHAHKTRSMVDVLDTGTGARLNPHIFEITTAGSDRLSVCYEHHRYAEQILSGVFADDTWFVFVTGMDPGDAWTDEASWAKANPNLGISVGLEDLRAKCEKAQRVPADQNAFRRLHLNEWTEQEDRWLDMAAWRACGDPVDVAALEGRECFAGMDLSSTADLTAYVLVFGGDDGIVRVVPRFFLPEARVAARAERRDLAPLDSWVREGYLVATPGNVVDYDLVRAQLVADAARFNIREVALDPWNATHLATQLASDGFTCVETRQGFATLSAPTKHLETLVLSRKIAHGQHPVLGWCASNVAVETDPAGNIKPSKKRARDRIDGIVALVMGLDRLGRNTVEPTANLFIWE
jgi:phage terminase large subunit-like protein